jgi:hypothetical protein
VKSLRFLKLFEFNEYGGKVKCHDYMKIFKQFLGYANHFELLCTLHQLKKVSPVFRDKHGLDYILAQFTLSLQRFMWKGLVQSIFWCKIM